MLGVWLTESSFRYSISNAILGTVYQMMSLLLLQQMPKVLSIWQDGRIQSGSSDVSISHHTLLGGSVTHQVINAPSAMSLREMAEVLEVHTYNNKSLSLIQWSQTPPMRDCLFFKDQN